VAAERSLLGRSAEQAALARLVNAAGRGESSALVIHGDPGIGKSALLDCAVEMAEQGGLRVLRARGVEAEAEVPYAGLSELLGPVLGLRSAIPDVQAAALGAALALEGPSEPERFVVAAAVLSLLAAAAEEQPLLAAVDDAHWLDNASLEALLFAARRLQAEGVVVLLAARSEPDRGLFGRGLEVMELGALSGDDARDLLMRAAGDRIPEPAVTRLLEAAGGNPLALLELPSALTAGQLERPDELPGPVRPGAAVEEAFRVRLAELPRQTVRALVVVAADEMADLDTHTATLERLGLGAGALVAAERAGLVHGEAERVEFRHPLLRAVAYHSAPMSERREVHAALADAHEERGGTARAAWHRAAAATGPDDAVADQLDRAAQEARGRGALDGAALALARAADLTTDPVARARRLLRSARAFAASQQPARAAEIAAAGVDLAAPSHASRPAPAADSGTAPSGATGAGAASSRAADPGAASSGQHLLLRADLQRVRGEVLIRMGEFDAAQDILVVEAERIADLDPGRAAEMLLAASVRHRASGDYREMRRLAERARELAEAAGSPAVDFADIVLAHVAAVSGRAAEADAIIARLEPLLTSPDPPDVTIELLASPAHASLWLEREERAERILGPLVARARERSAVSALIFPLAIRAQLRFREGHWKAAYADGEEAARLASDSGQLSLVAYSSGVIAEISAALGHADEARAHAETALAITDPTGSDAIGIYARGALGQLELSLGEPADALRPLEWCEAAAERMKMGEPNIVRWAPDLVEARLRTGAAAEAAATLERLEQAAEATGGTWARASATRCRGMLEDDFEPWFERALELFDGKPFETARTHLARGDRLLASRRRADAREPLAEAAAVFERLGATAWAERARAGQRTSGQRVQRRAAPTDELTPHELRVALLVAQGKTNPEVAAQLFVSRKTVEFHLSQVYRKLGLRSRTELARVLAAELPEHPARRALATD
jgi:DNA-binding CsgD family transcriptional regulator